MKNFNAIKCNLKNIFWWTVKRENGNFKLDAANEIKERQKERKNREERL